MAQQLTGIIGPEIQTGTAAKTVLQVIAPTNTKVRLRKWAIFFRGVSSSAEPILVELLRQTTAGTVTSLTPVALSPAGATPQVTASHTATAEPTAGDVLARVYAHPQGSGYAEIRSPDLSIDVAGGGRIGLRVTAAADVKCVPSMEVEE